MTNLPGDWHTLSPWFPLVRNARSVGKSGGFSVLHITVIVDEMANPVLFTQPEAVRLFPKDTTREAINELLSKMTGRNENIDTEGKQE